MIKVKILNPIKGRNEPTFRPLFFIRDMLYHDYGIELIVDGDDYDFLFVGMADFLDKKKPLQESIDWGLENLEKVTEGGDYFLFDGSDSTSLMGAYEVFEKSNAIYLLKNQLLNNREDYNVNYSFNKWFFGRSNGLNLAYDIPEDMWKRIRFTGYNLGYLLPQYKNFLPINDIKPIDVCAIFSAKHGYSEDHGVRNDIPYMKHRKSSWVILNNIKDKYEMITEKLPFDEYIRQLRMSKISLSPFGQGEICFRDYEAIQYGTLLIKPNQSIVNTYPNIFIEDETYVGVNLDWSNLEEKIDHILMNFHELNQTMNETIRELFLEKYTHENLCNYWYKTFKELNNVK